MSPLWFVLCLWLLSDEHPKPSPPIERVSVGGALREFPRAWAHAAAWLTWSLAIIACVAGAVLLALADRGVLP